MALESTEDGMTTTLQMPTNSKVESHSNDEKLHDMAEPSSESPVVDKNDEVWSTFSIRSKRMIVLAVSLGSFFSPISSNIYLPSLPEVARDLHVSNSLISLTVTVYLIFQGLAPTIVAGFSDTAGRRLAYMICFAIFIPANIGLALQNNYAALMVLRCIQACGSSGTVALAQGVVADLVTSSERGMYMAYATVGSILAPALGPVIGGLIGQFAGWHWIFWFLAIFSGCYFIPLLLFLPETNHNLVGDSSYLPPGKLSWSVTDVIRHRRKLEAGFKPDEAKQQQLKDNYGIRFPNPLATLYILFEKEGGILLLFNGVVFACVYAFTTSLSTSLNTIYDYNQIESALCFLPFAAGSLPSNFTTGRLIDWNYRRHAKRTGFPLQHNRRQDMTDFPLEKARLEVSIPYNFTGAGAMLIYGWLLQAKTSVAGPLVMSFFFGWSVLSSYQVLNIFLVDMYPDTPATATAANNLTRCLFGAGFSAAVTPMIKAIGYGWTFTIFGGLWLALTPSVFLLIKKGPQWRKERKEMLDALKAAEKSVSGT